MTDCKHKIVFNYEAGLSRCGECGELFVTLKNGNRISLSDLIEYFESNYIGGS